MASVHRQPNRPFWFGSYTTGSGKRHLKSTKTKNKAQALVICRKWEHAARKAQTGTLTPDAAREVIAQGVSEIFLGANGDGLPRATVRQWAELWLESKALESAPATLARYRGTIEKFLGFLGKTADKDLEHLTSSKVEAFRNDEARRLSPSSANIALKVIRALFSSAVAKQLILRNPASAAYVKTIERQQASKRRPLMPVQAKDVRRSAK